MVRYISRKKNWNTDLNVFFSFRKSVKLTFDQAPVNHMKVQFCFSHSLESSGRCISEQWTLDTSFWPIVQYTALCCQLDSQLLPSHSDHSPTCHLRTRIEFLVYRFYKTWKFILTPLFFITNDHLNFFFHCCNYALWFIWFYLFLRSFYDFY